MSRYINPPPAPQSPIKHLPNTIKGRESVLQGPQSLKAPADYSPEDTSSWESRNFGSNVAQGAARLAGFRVADQELDRIVHHGEQQEAARSGLGSPQDHRRRSRREGLSANTRDFMNRDKSKREWFDTVVEGVRGSDMDTKSKSPARTGFPARSGHQPNVGWEEDPAISSQAALKAGPLGVAGHSVVEATYARPMGPGAGRHPQPHERGDKVIKELLPGPAATRNKARAAQQQSWKDPSPTFEQPSMF